LRIEDDVKLDFNDVLIKPKRSNLTSRGDVDLARLFTFKYGKASYAGIPILSANMDTVGTIEMHKAFRKHHMAVALHKHYSIDELVKIHTDESPYPIFYSTGITSKNHTKLKEFADKIDGYIDFICVDIANGYQQAMVNYIKDLRSDERFVDSVIMAGNVVTADMTEALILAGADIVKVGIGSGSVCTTRLKTGVGYPQLSAIIECADAAHGLGGHVCADGGITNSGDIAKAFGAGADFVMAGGLFAGHEESAGQKIIDRHGTITHKEYYGMSSTTAMDEHSGGVAKHRASEGKLVRIPYRGNVESTINELLGGLRSTCTYTGAKTLKELSKRTTFVRVSRTHNTVYGDDWQTQ